MLKVFTASLIMYFKDYNSAIGQTNAISVAMVEAVRHAGWADVGDEMQLLRHYCDTIKQDFELRNTFQKLGTNTSIQEQINQLCVINNNILKQLISLKQEIVQLTHDVKQDLVQMKKTIDDIVVEIHTLKTSHPSSPFYTEQNKMQANSTIEETSNVPASSKKRSASEAAIDKSLTSNSSFSFSLTSTATTISNISKQPRLTQPSIKPSIGLDKQASMKSDIDKNKINVGDLLFMLSRNKQLQNKHTKLEDTWLTHLPNNERQKYKDTMKVSQIVWDTREERLVRSGGAGDDASLLTVCKSIQHKVFKVTEQLEKDYTGRSGKVSAQAKPTYLGIGNRLTVVKKAISDAGDIAYDEAIKRSFEKIKEKS